ncbi:MAG: hypothetical protein JWM07_445 [Candidatus Saccharibacteria bacterium]|nr:hypothetical protein [Candidatus Saccharibacteria bacterium]
MKRNPKARKPKKTETIEHPHAFTRKIGKKRKSRIDRDQYKGRVNTEARRMNHGERRVTNMECTAASRDGGDIDIRPMHILARANQQY